MFHEVKDVRYTPSEKGHIITSEQDCCRDMSSYSGSMDFGTMS